MALPPFRGYFNLFNLVHYTRNQILNHRLMKKTLLVKTVLPGLVILLSFGAPAQNVGINDDNSAPDPNAMLDVKSSSKGVLFPRLNTAQRNTLGAANPAEGMLVFDTDVEAYFYFTNSAWVQLATGGNSGVPVGTILAYGDDTPPPGYLICDGSPVSNAAYPALFAAIGTTWGGDGTPNFHLPDLRGRFLRGWDNGLGRDPDSGSRANDYVGGATGDNVGSYQSDAFQNHYHLFFGHNQQENTDGAGTGVFLLRGESWQATGYAENGNRSSETRPKNANVNYIIKY